MVDFPGYFAGMETKLRAELDIIRTITTHAGNKGSKAEGAFRTFLSDHLPRSLEIGHGEAIDQNGSEVGDRRGGEKQIDALIINDSHPRFGKIEDPNTYFIEGVLAAGEVKSSLQMGQVEAIFDQAVAFKKLRAKTAPGDMAFSNEEDLKRFNDHRPYFLFAYETTVKPAALLQRLLKIQLDRNVGSTDHFDAIFLLGHGCMFNLGTGNSSFKMRDLDGNFISGWGLKGTETLMPLIGWLSAVMPKIVHFSPIALPYLVKSV